MVATQIVAGDEHTLALLENGTVVAWGDNSKGQCDVPAGLSGVIDLAAGRLHSLVLREDGTVVEWGSSYTPYYVPPSGLSGVTAVAAGRDHSLALKSDGTVVAWGSNLGGQCSPPSGLSGVTAVDGGASFSVALKSDGTVVAWGNDYYGQSTPPAGLSDVTAIAVNQHYTLALKSDGTVVAWGWNNLGQCDVPPGLTDVDAIAAGDGHALALGGLLPIAAFSASPTTGTAPLTVQFTDASTNAPTAWSWNFGDGRTSIAQSPSHTYSTAGTYTVALTVTNAGGSDTETKNGYITVSAAPPTAPTEAAGSPAFPYSQQRKETLSFLLMCWGGLAFVGVFCVVIFLVMNGAQRGSGGI